MPVMSCHAVDALTHEQRHEGFEHASQADEKHPAPKRPTMRSDERQQSPERTATGLAGRLCFADAQFLTSARGRRLTLPSRFRAGFIFDYGIVRTRVSDGQRFR